ncbi:mechanosensitive ion channel protein 10-like [Diospyros lotus]|uniref:mechanosensitive ion channel protein 10-like n=1 Tax=Diospyros lotus TaxID=55363 RepID=UPI002250B3B3|nr:mechanosensitive ion channel protein 10-like [Diospyros lotus]
MDQKPNSDQVVVFVDQPNNIRTQQSHPAGEPKTTPPPQLPSRAQTLRRLSFSKPKARSVEFNLPPPPYRSIPESEELEPLKPNFSVSDDDYSSDIDDEELEDGEEGTRVQYRKKRRKIRARVLVEWVLFLIILTCLVCSLTITSFKHHQTWGLESWKWCLMVMVLFSGRLVSGWVMGFIVFLIERNFMLRERVLYFVYGLRKSFQNCVWLGLVLLSWTFMFNAKVHKKNKMLKKLFQALVAVLIGATIWLIKIVLVKVLASSFHVATYFDRMKESVFHHYILETLSGPPMDEVALEEEARQQRSHQANSKLRKGKSLSKSKKFGSRRVDMETLKKLSTGSRSSAWSVKRLVNYVRSVGLSTISKTVDEFGRTESEITSEWEARNCAKRIFKNVARPGAKYIEEEDLMRFLTRVEIYTIFPLFEGALETGRITKSSFRNWVVRAYLERKALAHSLNDTKTAVQQLHRLASAVVSVIITVVSLLVMGLATVEVILFVITQLVLVGFMFQNTCKTVFESIIFVFVMHPFDIGDRCVVDGVQMIVEEMNILTTVFLRYDMEKIYYPNSVLLTKPISNFYRSPDMCDTVNFAVDVSTSIESINGLKKAIQMYLESKPKHWSPKHSVIVKEIEDMNKMKMCLCVQHTINHQNYGERNNRMTDLILEMKKMFESLGIKYHLLPQEVHLTQVAAANWRLQPAQA